MFGEDEKMGSRSLEESRKKFEGSRVEAMTTER